MTALKPHPPVVLDKDGAPVGIDWERLVNEGLVKP